MTAPKHSSASAGDDHQVRHGSPNDHAARRAAHDRRQRTAFALQRHEVTGGTFADRVFFVAGAVVSVWLIVAITVQGARFGWGWYLAVLVAGWLVLAYLTLPRVHRVLTAVYVPNYFIGRARTSDGLLGDPVNVAVVGAESQLHRAMLDAGWTRADDITAQSTWRIVASTISRRSYDEAPVSPLFLFGRRQDFAYQQEVDGNPGKRHHVRFWRCPDEWPLPGGRRVDWLAAGTYDRAVGFSLFTLQVTHKIDENTDIERDHIVSTVRTGNADVRVTVIRDFATGYHSRNGGGDAIQTDGDLPILDVRSLPIDESLDTVPSALILDATGLDTAPSGPPMSTETRPLSEVLDESAEELVHDLWSRRPLALVVGCALTVVASVIGVWRFLWQMSQPDAVAEFQLDPTIVGELGLQSTDEFLRIAWTALLVGSAVAVALQLVFAVFTAVGARAARVVLMSVLLFTSVSTLIQLGAGTVPARLGLLVDLGNLLVQVGALLALSSTASREFVAARRLRLRLRRRARRAGAAR